MFKYYDECRLLKWAAGADIDTSDINQINERKICEYLTWHRLAGRFIERVQRERPSWVTEKIIRILSLEQKTAMRMFNKQVSEVKLIGEKLKSLGYTEPLIIIKGFTTYSITGKKHSLHRSADIDLLYSQPELLTNILYEMGYGINKEKLAKHEFASLIKEDIEIEVHNYFPFSSFTYNGIDAGEVIWLNPEIIKETLSVDFVEMEKNITSGVTSLTKDVTFLNTSMAIILLAHSIVREFSAVLGGIKLGDLADINEFIMDSTFNSEEFFQLVDYYNSHETIKIVCFLISEIFGHNPFPQVGLPRHPVLHSQKMFNIYMKSEINEILLPDIDGIIHKLRYNNQLSKINTIVQSDCLFSNHEISISLDPIPSNIEIIRLHLYFGLSLLFSYTPKGIVKWKNNDFEANFFQAEDKFNIRISIPNKVLGRVIDSDSKPSNALLRVMYRNQNENEHNSILVPVKINQVTSSNRLVL